MKTHGEQPLPSHVLHDGALRPFLPIVRRRLRHADEVEARLTSGTTAGHGSARPSLREAAGEHLRFGLHRTEGGWVFREWAPHASAIHLRGAFSRWRDEARFALRRISEDGTWELELPADTLGHGDRYHLHLQWPGDKNGPGGMEKRIPAYATRVVQLPDSAVFDAEVWNPATSYRWQHSSPPRPRVPLVYEAHVGIATEELRVGTYAEFQRNVLPRIVAAGYNTLQLMAVAEHPYYGSFGYHVSNFFAPSSRFGTPDDLRKLVDEAHRLGLRVVFDLVHSHAARNEVEGLSRFDGTEYQYFHAGYRGQHEAWDTRCFDYAKPPVLRFLLSNIRYWLEEFHCDGFRFDGVTSMLYSHHGLGRDFLAYDEYYDDSVDEDAIAYLILANRLIHQLRPDATTIAEDMSGMPGLATPGSSGGYGFDYRLAMGIPDFWTELAKHQRDEDWPVGEIFYRLNNRRPDEPTIAYSESHDQAIVGDQTLIFRLMGAEMYEGMTALASNWRVDRGIALSKLIRLLTIVVGGEGYLNFLGNEFGHPDWIDFPREGNAWSYEHARRQWRLADDETLRYRFIAAFDHDLLSLVREHGVLESAPATLLREHRDHQLLTFYRGPLLFLVNFHPTRTAQERFEVPPGHYRPVIDTESTLYGGLRPKSTTRSIEPIELVREEHIYHELHCPLPPRSAIALHRG